MVSKSKGENEPTGPLVVDLDGTLVATDTLVEAEVGLVRKQRALWRAAALLFRGRARFKQAVASYAGLDPALLPYRQEVLNYLRQQKREGRNVVLATAADRRIADAVAGYLGLFSEVLASDGKVNLSGRKKAEALVARFGSRGFSYVGDSYKDVAVWREAESAVVVTGSRRLVALAKGVSRVERVFWLKRWPWREIWREMRVYQWVKNLLIFIPLIAIHEVGDWSLLGDAVIAFFSFSLAASAVYVGNDLLDLPADRSHPEKSARPLAAGSLYIWQAVWLMPTLLALALLLGWQLPRMFTGLLVSYLALSSLYSLYLKQVVLVDVVLLASLYVLRVLAGGVATQVPVSSWLLALIMFFALSGALGKRYVELDRVVQKARGNANGRGYRSGDKQLVGQLGVVSGYLSVLVLALYINGDEVVAHYSQPFLLWFVAMLWLYWISRVWLMAYRGGLHVDPVMFVIRDRISWWVVGLMAAVVLLAI